METVRTAAYGAGVNSTAMIIGLTEMGIILDAILFADPGAEKPGTYAFLDRFDYWLQAQGQAPVTRIKRTTKDGDARSLEQHCIENHVLPSIAYGYKQCSQKFKVAPQVKWMNHFLPARIAWASGSKVTQYIGFDAGEARRMRADDDKYHYCYPLIEWGWSRKRCEQEILDAGLMLPPKSSCFFCPNMKKTEILALPDGLKQRAVFMEQNAQSTLRELKGLGRSYRWQDLLDMENDEQQLYDDLDFYDLPCACSAQ